MNKAKSVCALLILLLLPSIALVAYAHPGRTDSRGGHTNHSTGEYHYHHGYSAHDHYDIDGDGIIDCPYDFDGQTDHSSNSIESNEKASKPEDKKSPRPVLIGILAVGIYLFFMFILPFLLS